MNKKLRNILIAVVTALVVGSCIFMFTISPISVKKGNREMPEANGETKEITSGIIIEQKFRNFTENINEIAVVFSRLYTIEDKISINIELLEDNNLLIKQTFDARSIEGNHRTYLKSENPLSGYADKDLTLRISSDTTAGTGLALMMSNSDDTSFMFGNESINGTICFSVTGNK